jgi:hypothetical protein
MTTWTRLRLVPALFNRGESAVPYRWQPRRDSSTGTASFPVSLLMLAGGLRLINGVHATAVVQGFINHPMGALSYGTIAFTGPGTLAATFALRGSLGSRMRLVIGLYLGIILPGALLTLVLLPAIQAVLLPESAVFSAIMVGGLALQAFGVDPARIASPVHPGRDRFASIRLLANPQAVLAIYLGASLLNMIVTHTYLHIRLSIPSVSQIVGTLLAVGSGMSITVAIGGVLAHRFREGLSSLWACRAGGLPLLCLALQILGAPIPFVVAPALLAFGIVAGIWQSRREHMRSLGLMAVDTGAAALLGFRRHPHHERIPVPLPRTIGNGSPRGGLPSVSERV